MTQLVAMYPYQVPQFQHDYDFQNNVPLPVNSNAFFYQQQTCPPPLAFPQPPPRPIFQTQPYPHMNPLLFNPQNFYRPPQIQQHFTTSARSTINGLIAQNLHLHRAPDRTLAHIPIKPIAAANKNLKNSRLKSPTQTQINSILNHVLSPSSQQLTGIQPIPSISGELHINLANANGEQRTQVSEHSGEPSLKLTITNQQAVERGENTTTKTETTMAPTTTTTSEAAAAAAAPSNDTSNNIDEGSPAESIELIELDDESDGEHSEMGRNWRMMTLFRGLLKDDDLPENCGRPQTNEGRTYPEPTQIVEEGELMEDEGRDNSDGQQQQDEGMTSAAEEQQRPSTSREILKQSLPPSEYIKNRSHGYILPNGTTWVRHKQLPTNTNINGTGRPTRQILLKPLGVGLVQKLSLQQAQHRPASTEPLASSAAKMRFGGFANKSLLITKNGKRLYAGSKECYKFIETGKCSNGIFCIFEHNGSTDHQRKKVCPRLLNGLCRGTDDSCPVGPHSSLLPHQIPVCDYYIRMVCAKGKDECPYLHVKHTPGTEPCVDFNRGSCQRGVMCPKPHRYYYSLRMQKEFVAVGGSDNGAKKRSASSANGLTEECRSDSPKILKWIQ